MKKIILFAALALITGVALTSCRKCETCTAYNTSDNTVYYEDHYCGGRLLVNTWEDSFKSSYDYGDTYVECKKD